MHTLTHILTFHKWDSILLRGWPHPLMNEFKPGVWRGHRNAGVDWFPISAFISLSSLHSWSTFLHYRGWQSYRCRHYRDNADVKSSQGSWRTLTSETESKNYFILSFSSNRKIRNIPVVNWSLRNLLFRNIVRVQGLNSAPQWGCRSVRLRDNCGEGRG